MTCWMAWSISSWVSLGAGARVSDEFRELSGVLEEVSAGGVLGIR